MSLKYLAVLLILGFFVSVLTYPDPNGRKNSFADEIIVSTSIGQLRCLQATNPLGVISCKGVPYAQPPTGSLRFRAPVPINFWSGVKDATQHGNECIQPGGLPGIPAKGDEDCLYLNVYTPSLQGNRAVMVFIHGGAYVSGSGNDGNYGPQLLLQEDVVVVTINYRLGVLGFLSTGDNNAQGNYGLKDATEALKWVIKNIQNFGGDPNRITAFGQSAGGAMVHYLLLFSKLFNRAISQSGTALSPWAFQPDPRRQAFELGQRLGINVSSTLELITALRQVQDPKIFAEALELELDERIPDQFAPSIENVDSQEPRLVLEHPIAAIKRRNFNQVPFMVGGNSEDALYAVLELAYFPSIAEKINQNPELLVPPTWLVTPGSRESDVIATELRNLYFTNGRVSDGYEYSQYCTDLRYLYSIYKTVKLHAEQKNPPVYFYNFGFSGENNYGKIGLGLSDYPGAVHADEFGYMFNVAGMVPRIGTIEATVSARLTRLWTNFAKFSNPTPEIDGIITVQWPQVFDNQEFLNITDVLRANNQPFYERMTTLLNLDEQYSWKP